MAEPRGETCTGGQHARLRGPLPAKHAQDFEGTSSSRNPLPSEAPGGWTTSPTVRWDAPASNTPDLWPFHAKICGKSPYPYAARGIALGDLNGDGLLDAVVADSRLRQVGVLLNQPSF